MISAEEFEDRFGAEPQPWEDPGPPHGTRAEIQINTNETTSFKAQCVNVELMRSHLLKQVPDYIFESDKDDYGSLDNLSLVELCTSVFEKLGRLTDEDIDELKAMRALAYANEPIARFVATRLAIDRQLARVGETRSEREAIKETKKCFAHLDFEECWSTFANLHQDAEDRTLTALFEVIERFVKDVYSKRSTARDLQMNIVEEYRTEIMSLRGEVKNLTGCLLALQSVGQAPLSATPNSRGKKGKITFKDGPHIYFCWTHGPCRHEPGTQCQFPQQGHQAQATWRNQMGSPWKILWRHQGRPTE